MNLRTLRPEWGITVIRVMAGIIITVAGIDKLGAGFDAFTKSSANFGLPLPELWGTFIPLLETIGGLLILFGFGARWVALLFVVEYAVTSFALKAPRQPPFGGFNSMRIDLMLWVSALTIVLVGPGALALESLVIRRGRREAPMAGRALTT
jgi:uncharacterized membrane protein YphA (DoxX/SURF4 family)